jgi:hypothetical protein
MFQEFARYDGIIEYAPSGRAPDENAMWAFHQAAEEIMAGLWENPTEWAIRNEKLSGDAV